MLNKVINRELSTYNYVTRRTFWKVTLSALPYFRVVLFVEMKVIEQRFLYSAIF